MARSGIVVLLGSMLLKDPMFRGSNYCMNYYSLVRFRYDMSGR